MYFCTIDLFGMVIWTFLLCILYHLPLGHPKIMLNMTNSGKNLEADWITLLSLNYVSLYKAQGSIHEQLR